MTPATHPRVRELLAFLDQNRALLQKAVASVPPGRREVRPDPDRWSVAEILEHLAIAERRISRLIAHEIAEGRAAGLGPERDSSSVVSTLDVARLTDRTRRLAAAGGNRPTSGLDAAQAWAALEESREAIRAALVSGDGLALGERVQPHPFFGPLNLYQWVLFVGAHEARHAQQIRELA